MRNHSIGNLVLLHKTHLTKIIVTSISPNNTADQVIIPEKDARLRELHRRQSAMNKRLSRLKVKLDEATAKSGVSLEDDITKDLVDIMETHSEEVTSFHSEDSFPPSFLARTIQGSSEVKEGNAMAPSYDQVHA